MNILHIQKNFATIRNTFRFWNVFHIVLQHHIYPMIKAKMYEIKTEVL